MLDAVARPARRSVWGWAYIGLGMMGVAALIPTFSPPGVWEFLPFAVYVWGAFQLFYFVAAYCSFRGKAKLEQAFLWLGSAGLATYVLTLWQRFIEGDYVMLSGAIGFTVLLGLMVSTGVWLGQHVRREARRKKIVAIAERE